MSPLEQQLAMQIRAAGLPTPEREAMLVPGRKFRCDFAWPDHGVALEVEGGLYRSPRTGKRGVGHTSTTQILRDMEKHSLLAIAGYRLLRVGEKHIRDGRALAWIARALKGEDVQFHIAVGGID